MSILAITLYNFDNSPNLSIRLLASAYINYRAAEKVTLMDTSQLKIGKNAFPNRLNCEGAIKFNSAMQ